MEQLTTDGGAEEIVEMDKGHRPAVHYARFGPGTEMGVREWMASEETRRAAVVRIFGSEYDWQDHESVLWNWINAHAERYFNGDYNEARRMINDASDPIFGGPNYKAIAQFIWFLA